MPAVVRQPSTSADAAMTLVLDIRSRILGIASPSVPRGVVGIWDAITTWRRAFLANANARKEYGDDDILRLFAPLAGNAPSLPPRYRLFLRAGDFHGH